MAADIHHIYHRQQGRQRFMTRQRPGSRHVKVSRVRPIPRNRVAVGAGSYKQRGEPHSRGVTAQPAVLCCEKQTYRRGGPKI